MVSVSRVEQPESLFVEAAGINHHYLDWGKKDGPPLLMLHGASHCAQVWDFAAKTFCDLFHVLCFDQRGHGDSAAPGDGYTFDQLGYDLSEIIRQLELDWVNILAHSSGGFASIIADSLQSGSIGRAVLIETRMTRRTQGSIGQERVERTRQKQSVWESRDSFYRFYRGRSAFASWEEEIFRDFIDGCSKVLEDGRAQLKCSPEVEAAFYASRDDLDLFKYMDGLQGQYLLLLGDYPGGQAPDSEGVQQFQKLVPGSHVKAMGKGTHFLPMEFPELALNEAREFFLQDRE